MKRLVSSLCIALISLGSLAACGGGQSSEVNKPQTELSKLAGPEDLKQVQIAVQRGTVGETLAQELLGDKAQNQLLSFELYPQAIEALKQHKVQAIIMDEKPAQAYLSSNKDSLMILPEPIQEESYAIGIKKGNSELKQAVDKALKELKSNGELEKIFAKYEGKEQTELAAFKASDIDLNPEGKKGSLIVGLKPDFPPYEYLDSQGGYLGIDVELSAALAKALDYKLEFRNMAFDALPAALNAGQVDLICSGLTVTEERLKNMDFSEVYYEGAKQVALILKADYAGAKQ